MKTTSHHRTSILNLFTDFSSPTCFSDPFSLTERRYKEEKESPYPFLQTLLSEGKRKSLYRALEALFHKGLARLEEQKANGKIESNIHPLEEKKWFVSYLSEKVSEFSSEELWLVILNHEEREKYAKYFEEGEDIDAFELFFENYFLNALSGQQLYDILFLIQNLCPNDQEECFMKFFQCLSAMQTRSLFRQLKDTQMPYIHWHTVCEACVPQMRNAQVVQSLSFFPTKVAVHSLKRLYPQEVIDVISSESDGEKKRLFTDKTLRSCRQWWGFFCQDEINQAIAYLNELET